MAGRVNILFPVETINRELDSRLTLAFLVASRENRILIGHHDLMFRIARKLRGGIYMGQTLFGTVPLELSLYRTVKSRGISLIYLDEEGGIYPGNEERWRQLLLKRIEPRHLHDDDYLCTWGEFQTNFYRALEEARPERILTTGHPRFDLYKCEYRAYFEPETKAIRDEWGEFILINTNFVLANNALGVKDTFSERNGYSVDMPELRRRLVRGWAHSSNLVGAFVRLAHRLSETNPDNEIVVRPHPSENHNFYRTALSGLPNVHVVHDGAVTPWILACAVLVHSGCTTAVEACLADRPVVTYRPLPDPENELFLPNSIGTQCRDEEAAVDAVREALSFGGRRSMEFSARAQSVLQNLKKESIPVMVDLLNDVQGHQSPTDDLGSLALEQLGRRLLETAKGAIRPLFPARQRNYRYSTSKFYGLAEAQAERKAARLRELFNKDVTWRFFGDKLMLLEVP